MNEQAKNQLYHTLLENFNFRPTSDQEVALRSLSDFCVNAPQRHLFLLQGYAGTGKTSLIKAIVQSLPTIKLKSVLMAPTGRAAKVITQYSGHSASTIHRHIYRPRRGAGGGMNFILRENKAFNTVYIVDESSMINDHEGGSSETSGLLHDLLEFVVRGTNCSLILVGDIAQLPPVGSLQSPALDRDYLRRLLGFESTVVELREVMRQAEESAILKNATGLRQLQNEESYVVPEFKTANDFIRLLEGFEVEDALQQSFREAGREGTAIIVRSNKRANLYNRQIRHRILWLEEEIAAGDFLMVVKNNYFWLPKGSKAGFIANGDIIELLEIYEFKNLYGFRFARVKVRMVDYEDEAPFETVLMLDVLDKAAAALNWQESSNLYKSILEDYADEPSRYKRYQKVLDNPYYNALQVKFAYALTCHKAQGGQWENVFIEQPWLPEGKIDLDYLRWLYTALTRATGKVYLMGFADEYFSESQELDY